MRLIMGIFHYLNVNQGDCSFIQHPSGHVTVVDVCNASKTEDQTVLRKKALAEILGVSGNFNQKEHPVNPIIYLKSFGVESVFRFILTHPDMDHMGGIADFFDVFAPLNFWDTANTCKKDFSGGGPHDENDWKFYVSMRDGGSANTARRLTLCAGARGQYYNQSAEDGLGGGDGLYVLAPTAALINGADESGNYNDGSYVILCRSAGGRILLAGDSHDRTWEHVLENYEDDVRNVDLLIAPHHGRKSDRSYDFLDVVNPGLTLFGNANSEHLAYAAWNYRGLRVITNNQANCVVVDTNRFPMTGSVTNPRFAERVTSDTFYSPDFKAYYVGKIIRSQSNRAA
jgi:beta-lactamase superfamily II metal-dependent hydrolase